MFKKEGGWAQNQEFVLNVENPVTEQKKKKPFTSTAAKTLSRLCTNRKPVN